MSEDSDFRRVTFQKEREKILSDLESKSIVLAGLTDDQHQFLFNVRNVRGEILYIEPIVPVGRGLKRGENLQVLFGLPDGLYLLKTKIESAEEPFLIDFGPDLFRLQRRNNFRTTIPNEMRLAYRLIKFRNDVVSPPVDLSVIDLSAGGVRVKWLAKGLDVPRVGDQIGGVLHLPSGKQLELFGTVKNLFPMEGNQLHVGVEFQNLSIRDEQALLFVCMQIHREQAPVVK